VSQGANTGIVYERSYVYALFGGGDESCTRPVATVAEVQSSDVLGLQ